MNDAHHAQRAFCEKEALRPILNVACKEDPARLFEFDATNMDLLTYDPHMKCDLEKQVPNFVQGDAKNLPFDDKSYGTIVIGELFEHCIMEAAILVLNEAKRVLNDDPGARVCATYPFDARPAEQQHAKHLLVEWSPGITSWHQTVWEDDMMRLLAAKCGFNVHSFTTVAYSIQNVPEGRCTILKKA